MATDLLVEVPHRVQVLVDMGMIGTADLVEELAAEVRALHEQLAVAHNVIRRYVDGWHFDSTDEDGRTWYRFGPLDGYEASDENEMTPAEAAVIRAATADPTPQTDSD